MLKEKDKQVITAIASYPLLTDEKLSDKLQMKRTTFTAGKNKLKKEKIYSANIIPYLQNLNCEFLRFSYGSFNPEKKFSEIKKDMKGFIKRKNVFFFACDREYFFEVGFVRNFADYEKQIEENFSFYLKNEIIGLTLVDIPLFFENAKIFNFFASSSLFNKETNTIPFVRKKLSKKERQILKALVENPELSDSDLEKKTDIARQTFSKFRKNYEGKLFRQSVNLNFKEVGFKFFAMLHSSFHPLSTQKERSAVVEKVLKHQCTFSAFKNSEFALIGIYNEQKFYEYQSIVGITSNSDLLRTKSISFEISELELLKNFDFRGTSIFI